MSPTSLRPKPSSRDNSSRADKSNVIKPPSVAAPPLLDRPPCRPGHPGKRLNFSFQGERLGREVAMLEGVPVASRSPLRRACGRR
jgi:hypothetical protein